MFKVRTYNQISVKGLERFSRQHYEVGSDIGHPDAYLLRSQKLQGVEVPDTLLAVARAGAGVNNVPDCDNTASWALWCSTRRVPMPTRSKSW
jgi:D-3-phosphoglycerate dehydrogenase